MARKLIDYSDSGSTVGAVDFPQVQLPPPRRHALYPGAAQPAGHARQAQRGAGAPRSQHRRPYYETRGDRLCRARRRRLRRRRQEVLADIARWKDDTGADFTSIGGPGPGFSNCICIPQRWPDRSQNGLDAHSDGTPGGSALRESPSATCPPSRSGITGLRGQAWTNSMSSKFREKMQLCRLLSSESRAL